MKLSTPTLEFIPGFLGSPDDFAHLQIEAKGVLAGYSMGGRLALIRSLKERCRALILISTNPGLKCEKERAERLEWEEKWIKILDQFGVERFVNLWYDQPLFRSLKERRNLYESMIRRRNALSARAIKEMLTKGSIARLPNLWECEIKVPTLYLYGERDEKYRKIGEEFARKSPSITLNKVEGAGHALHLEEGQRCKHLIKEFLKQIG